MSALLAGSLIAVGAWLALNVLLLTALFFRRVPEQNTAPEPERPETPGEQAFWAALTQEHHVQRHHRTLAERQELAAVVQLSDARRRRVHAVPTNPPVNPRDAA